MTRLPFDRILATSLLPFVVILSYFRSPDFDVDLSSNRGSVYDFRLAESTQIDDDSTDSSSTKIRLNRSDMS